VRSPQPEAADLDQFYLAALQEEEPSVAENSLENGWLGGLFADRRREPLFGEMVPPSAGLSAVVAAIVFTDVVWQALAEHPDEKPREPRGPRRRRTRR
jgi:hypothetical protein